MSLRTNDIHFVCRRGFLSNLFNFVAANTGSDKENEAGEEIVEEEFIEEMEEEEEVDGDQKDGENDAVEVEAGKETDRVEEDQHGGDGVVEELESEVEEEEVTVGEEEEEVVEEVEEEVFSEEEEEVEEDEEESVSEVHDEDVSDVEVSDTEVSEYTERPMSGWMGPEKTEGSTPFDEPSDEDKSFSSWGNRKKEEEEAAAEQTASSAPVHSAAAASERQPSQQIASSERMDSQRSSGTPAQRTRSVPVDDTTNDDIETGVKSSRSASSSGVQKQRSHAARSPSSRTGGLPPPNDQRFRIIMVCLFVVGALAIVAIVLPFVLDDDDGGDGSRSDTDSPTTGPTMAPTAPRVPTSSPMPTTTPAPTMMPVPTISPAPTQAPIPGDPTFAPTTFRFSQFLEAFLIPELGEEPFEDRESAQYEAALFLSDFDDYIEELTSIEQLADRYAAAVFYFAAEGDDWDTCFYNDTNCESSWLEGDACGWFGLDCNENGRLISVNFGKIL